MKAICTTDVSQSVYALGTTNTDLPENSITFNLVLPLGTNSSYLTITDIKGTSKDTSVLNLEDNESTYVLDSSYYLSGAGTIKLVVHGSNNFTSNVINVFVEDTFTSADNIFVETADGSFTIKKIKTVSNSGGGGGVDTEVDPTVPQHVKDITQADIDKWNNKSDFSGSYSDLTDKPTNVTEFENDAGYVDRTVNDLINYYNKSETYNKDEVDNLVKDFLTGRITNGEYEGSYETSDGFLVQWGRARVTIVANVMSSHTLYFPIPYETTPMVLPNAFTQLMGTSVLGANIQSATPTSATIGVFRVNGTSTTVGFLAVGKKGVA